MKHFLHSQGTSASDFAGLSTLAAAAADWPAQLRRTALPSARGRGLRGANRGRGRVVPSHSRASQVNTILYEPGFIFSSNVESLTVFII